MNITRTDPTRGDRIRLSRAREYGYFDARRAGTQRLLRHYGLWCWRLKIPVVWVERQTPRSKYGRVHLDMFTTANRLTARGASEMASLYTNFQLHGPAIVSPHDASWGRVPLAQLEPLARAVLKAAFRRGNHEPADTKRPSNVISIMASPVWPSSRRASDWRVEATAS